MTLIGKINKQYVGISNKMSDAYSDKFGWLCDLYFPINEPNPDENGNYDFVNIFTPHQSSLFCTDPSVSQVKFVIPHLLKKESMNSAEDEFDAFYLEEDNDNRPFIETSKTKELPIATKVVVFLESSKMYFFVDKKTVVNGADGHMLMRQYLAPLAEG
jgi:hypothetical protein